MARIILQKPPVDLDFGLQKGAAAKHQMVQVQKSGGDDLVFVFTAEVKGDRQKTNQPDFGGPFVQGKLSERFVYINCGTASEQERWWTSRLKVPLTGVTWADIDQLQKSSSTILETTVPGTAKNGGPTMATVKPFDGWSVAAP